MWNNKSNKGVSLVEAMVAIFILGVIAAVVLNSSSIFTRSQQTLISSNRQDQMADLILQDIMEYTKFQNNLYGTITANAQTFGLEQKTIVVSGVTSSPQVGDMFLVDGVPGRYIIGSISGADASRTITSTTDFPQVSITNNTAITFIAFKKQDLNCFGNLNLSGTAPKECPDGNLMPSRVTALFNHWKDEIDNELGPKITTQEIDVTDLSLVTVTLGDGTNNTVLARKINNCIFNVEPSSAEFTFPGKADSVTTGIMEGSENPVAHYNATGRAQNFPNLDNDSGTLQNTTVTCTRTGASTCRQTYAGSNTISVFLYRYTGPSAINVRPTNCSNSLWPQCGGVVIEPQDLSLWFIFDEYNSTSSRNDTRNVGQDLPGANRGGYLLYEIRSLPNSAKILIFDDSSESCQGNISGGTCRGQYKWNNAHDGLVIHLDTPNLTALSDIQLEITGVPFGIKSWRVLKPRPESCLIASNRFGTLPASGHGDAWDIEAPIYILNDEGELEPNPASCWEEVNAEETKLTAQLLEGNTISMTVEDSSIFSASGEVQVGNELISYARNDRDTNTLFELVRGNNLREEAELGEAIPSSGVPAGQSWSVQRLDTSGNLGDPAIGFLGGYLKIDDEIFKADYANNFDNRRDNNIRFTARAQLGTSAQAHNIDATVHNHDMRTQTWNINTPVYEGSPNTIAVVQAEETTNFLHDVGNNATYPRVRMKKTVTLNLSSAEVCQ